MLPISVRMTKGLILGTRVNCIDNTGAKIIEIMAVLGYHGKIRRLPRCGVGDIAVCAVKKGKEKMVHQVVHAVIVRQKMAYRRPDGMRIKFADNAAVLINPKTYEPVGTEIKSVIAKEAVERFSTIGKIATMVL